ncbi:hypothetical protein PUNSTDRAFT_142740 [Punctularia strigosozonata HHB-11173 SS5]|uniref:uncharacterized protein n=1 Tax=Punctularia strigosozonata (strain HHB-11173) TaxID=741275 RepID=UPI000441834A|nr:uncharacterized protein PUNSTDRAFT_142740 [Punctularia strigosozonata HHB-11173 SS5]EIN10817.1 hypothetical protein PUNSTDRAFT_142740 [Punctularia strigosozonata HHB-11173 SS5]
MSPEAASAAPDNHSRQRHARAATIAGTVRTASQRSDTDAGSGEGSSRPPAKRARKPINCEPCRASKLKCDRNRPCSSCVLRGTSSMCYQDGSAPDQSEAGRSNPQRVRVDPVTEFARVRRSLALLEQYVLTGRQPSSPQPDHELSLISSPADQTDRVAKSEPPDAPAVLQDKAPGTLHRQPGGLYAGSTSVATHLASAESRESATSSERSSEEPEVPQSDYDRDLIALLPPASVIDKLISYYFNYCNWIYRHVNQPAFLTAWAAFKGGQSSDRITLATVCVILAIATYYLPKGHEYARYATSVEEDHGSEYYDVMRQALDRHRSANQKYTIELVELLLVRSHYLYLSKSKGEEVWQIRGELLTIATAMGLHRNPDRRLPVDFAERRRWAWWHILLLERWQAFMFGRPIGIAKHHFDTDLPSYCNPAIDPTGRLYLPNLAIIRLAYILGDIMDDAVSLRPVSHDRVMANDHKLLDWHDSLPPELLLDSLSVARSLASLDTSHRRLGVQSVIIRVAYLHIRFTLHRQYAAKAVLLASPNPDDHGGEERREAAQSLDIAIQAADELVSMVVQARPDFLANSELAVPGHLNWAPFHLFSAGMFFSFQLISNPDGPQAGLLRSNIKRIVDTLIQSQTMSVADKSLRILQALSPLYSDEFRSLSPQERNHKKSQVLSVVKKLAFPYHDSAKHLRQSATSPSGGSGSPSTSSSTISPAGRGSISLPASHTSVSSSIPSSGPTPPHTSRRPSNTPTPRRPEQRSPRSAKHARRHSPPLAGSSQQPHHYQHQMSPPTPSQPQHPYSSPPMAGATPVPSHPHSSGAGPSSAFTYHHAAPPPQHMGMQASASMPSMGGGGYEPHVMASQSMGNMAQQAAYAAPQPQDYGGMNGQAYGQSLRHNMTFDGQGVPAPELGPGMGMVWGANVGFAEGEWSQFLSTMEQDFGSLPHS